MALRLKVHAYEYLVRLYTNEYRCPILDKVCHFGQGPRVLRVGVGTLLYKVTQRERGLDLGLGLGLG